MAVTLLPLLKAHGFKPYQIIQQSTSIQLNKMLPCALLASASPPGPLLVFFFRVPLALCLSTDLLMPWCLG